MASEWRITQTNQTNKQKQKSTTIMMETSAFYLHISRQWSSSCLSVHLPAIHQNVKIKELKRTFTLYSFATQERGCFTSTLSYRRLSAVVLAKKCGHTLLLEKKQKLWVVMGWYQCFSLSLIKWLYSSFSILSYADKHPTMDMINPSNTIKSLS